MSRNYPTIVYVEELDGHHNRDRYINARPSPDVIAVVHTEGGHKNRTLDLNIYKLEETEYAKNYGPKVYRFDTPRIKGLAQPLIRIDMRYEMVYYLTEDSMENDYPVPEFVSRGDKIRYLVVYDKEAFLSAQFDESPKKLIEDFVQRSGRLGFNIRLLLETDDNGEFRYLHLYNRKKKVFTFMAVNYGKSYFEVYLYSDGRLFLESSYGGMAGITTEIKTDKELSEYLLMLSVQSL